MLSEPCLRLGRRWAGLNIPYLTASQGVRSQAHPNHWQVSQGPTPTRLPTGLQLSRAVLFLVYPIHDKIPTVCAILQPASLPLWTPCGKVEPIPTYVVRPHGPWGDSPSEVSQDTQCAHRRAQTCTQALAVSAVTQDNEHSPPGTSPTGKPLFPSLPQGRAWSQVRREGSGIGSSMGKAKAAHQTLTKERSPDSNKDTIQVFL